MISTSSAYQAAVVGSPRRIEILAVVDLSDPDLTWGNATDNGAAPWARPEQVHDKNLDAPPRYETLERNRFLLDGSFKGFPASWIVPEPIAWASAQLSGQNGTFPTAVWFQQPIENVRILHMSLPFGSVTLSMDNKDRRFEPRRKDGIFQSIEERQGVDVYIGVRHMAEGGRRNRETLRRTAVGPGEQADVGKPDKLSCDESEPEPCRPNLYP